MKTVWERRSHAFPPHYTPGCQSDGMSGVTLTGHHNNCSTKHFGNSSLEKE